MKLGELKGSPEAWFVIAAWLLTTIVALRFIHVFGWNFPYWDDFAHVPYLAHDRPVTIEWLWESHNEHRIPFGKLVLVVTSALSRGNYRLPMYLSASLLSAGGALFAVALVRKRGLVLYSDASIPLLVLNLAQWENLTWGHQVPFAMSAMVPLTFVTVSIWRPTSINLQGVIAAAAWGWGMSSAMFLGAAACLFGLRAFASRDAPGAHRGLCALWSLALLALLSSYIFSFHPGPSHEGVRTIFSMASYAARLLGDALVASPHAWPVPSIAVAIICLLTAVVFFLSPDRQRFDAVLTLVVFVLLTSATIVWGRVTFGVEQAFGSRYVTLLSPLICACYAIVACDVPRAPLRAFVSNLILVVCVAAYAYGAGDGVQVERERRGVRRTTLLAALTMEPAEVAMKFGHNLFPARGELATSLASLRREGMAAFGQPELVAKLRRTTREPGRLGITPLPQSIDAGGIEDDATLGADGLLLIPPARMAFALPAGAYTLRARYGFRPGAYLDGTTDGGEFSVWVDGSERRLLWHRPLRPATQEADRGPQQLLLTFDLETSSLLTLETSAGPAGDSTLDWMVWAGVDIDRHDETQ